MIHSPCQYADCDGRVAGRKSAHFPSVRLPANIRTAAAGQEVEIAAEIGLLNVIDVEPAIAALEFRRRFCVPPGRKTAFDFAVAEG